MITVSYSAQYYQHQAVSWAVIAGVLLAGIDWALRKPVCTPNKKIASSPREAFTPTHRAAAAVVACNHRPDREHIIVTKNEQINFYVTAFCELCPFSELTG